MDDPSPARKNSADGIPKIVSFSESGREPSVSASVADTIRASFPLNDTLKAFDCRDKAITEMLLQQQRILSCIQMLLGVQRQTGETVEEVWRCVRSCTPASADTGLLLSSEATEPEDLPHVQGSLATNIIMEQGGTAGEDRVPSFGVAPEAITLTAPVPQRPSTVVVTEAGGGCQVRFWPLR